MTRQHPSVSGSNDASIAFLRGAGRALSSFSQLVAS